MISPVPRPDLALHHLKYVRYKESIYDIDYLASIATSLSPEDPEIAFNLAAVLEASKYDMLSF